MKMLLILSSLILSNTALAKRTWTEVFPIVLKEKDITYFVGVSTVDVISRELNIKIYSDPCHNIIPPEVPQKIACEVKPILVDEYRVIGRGPIDDCGSVVYTGKQDLRPKNGGLTEITLTDNTARTCDNMLLGHKIATVIYQGARDSQPVMYTMISDRQN
jgi:hypothetical protein